MWKVANKNRTKRMPNEITHMMERLARQNFHLIGLLLHFFFQTFTILFTFQYTSTIFRQRPYSHYCTAKKNAWLFCTPRWILWGLFNVVRSNVIKSVNVKYFLHRSSRNGNSQFFFD